MKIFFLLDTNDAFREEDGAEVVNITECEEEVKNRLMFIEEMELFGKDEQSVKEYSLELRNVDHDLTLMKDNQFKGRQSITTQTFVLATDCSHIFLV